MRPSSCPRCQSRYFQSAMVYTEDGTSAKYECLRCKLMYLDEEDRWEGEGWDEEEILQHEEEV